MLIMLREMIDNQFYDFYIRILGDENPDRSQADDVRRNCGEGYMLTVLAVLFLREPGPGALCSFPLSCRRR